MSNFLATERMERGLEESAFSLWQMPVELRRLLLCFFPALWNSVPQEGAGVDPQKQRSSRRKEGAILPAKKAKVEQVLR